MIFLAAQPILEILEEHVDELGSLLARRGEAVRSPYYRPRDVRLLDARIVAHADALVLAGRDAEPLLVDVIEAGEDPTVIAGAAFALVQTEDSKVDLQPVLQRLSGAPPEVVRAIGAVWRLARPASARAALEMASRVDPPRAAALAMLALAATPLASAPQLLSALLGDDDPVVREVAWTILATMTWGGGLHPEFQVAGTWTSRLRADCDSEEPALREAALLAAVMTRQTFLRPLVLERAASGSRADLPAADLAAVLAEPQDLPVFVRLLARRELDLRRFDVAASYGTPAIVEPLIDAMASPESGISLAAEAAFRRITGLEVAAAGVVRAPADWRDEPADLEAELLEEVPRPDAGSARAQWSTLATGDIARAGRLCLGVALPKNGVGSAQGEAQDMRAWWHDTLRACYFGVAPTSREDLWRTLQPMD